MKKPRLLLVLAAPALTLLSAGLSATTGRDGVARAAGAESDGRPVFSDPLRFDNPWFPVDPGGVKVYLGRSARRRLTQVETHPAETRDFQIGGIVVTCRTVVTRSFLRGVQTSIETAWFAQADDGSVYCFGETDAGDDGDDDNSDDSPSGWIVGSARSGDPADTVSVAQPSLRMRADPGRGDAWTIEDLGTGSAETYRVLAAGRPVRVGAGRFESTLRVRESSAGRGDRETLWFAAGAGPVKSSGRGRRTQLTATSLRRR